VAFFKPDELPEQIAFEAQRQAIEDWRRGYPPVPAPAP
jgi:hypothetical protein